MSWKWLPNALTLIRCALAGLTAFSVIAGERFSRQLDTAIADWQAAGAVPPGTPGFPEALSGLSPHDLLTWPAIAFAAFLVAALTDLFDGLLARALDAQSAFGAWLDPIADKLLVGLVLAALAITSGSLWLMLPAAIIITRDGYITWLRARLGGGLALPVMTAAKWKTALEMLALGLLLSLPLLSSVSHSVMLAGRITPTEMTFISMAAERLGITLTWMAAGLSARTGFQYWRAARQQPQRLHDTFD